MLNWGVCTTPPVVTTVSSSSLVFCHQAWESDDALKVNEGASMPVSAILKLVSATTEGLVLFDTPRCKHNNDLTISRY